jgi:hypothetical protein
MTATSTLATIMNSLLSTFVGILTFVIINYWGYIIIFALIAGFITLMVRLGHKTGGAGK